MRFTKEERLLAEEFIQSRRDAKKAVEEYKKKYLREPCCERQALEGHCVCWQDSW